MPGLSPLFTWRSAVVSSDLPASHKLVCLCLSLHMNERAGSAFPSRRTLAAEASLSVRQTSRILSDLVRLGWLDGHDRFTESGRETTRVYVASVPLAAHLRRHAEGVDEGGESLWIGEGGEGHG